MRWPWQRTEQRAAGNGGGDFFNAVVAQIQAEASTKSADAGSTAAIEAAAGQLSRAFALAQPVGPDWARAAISPEFLAQVGRDLIRGGASLHRIDMAAGAPMLCPVAQWHWVGRTASPASWTVSATDYGPSGSRTDWLPYSGVVWVAWGVTTATPWVGRSPASWAPLTAKLSAEAERSMGDEAAGPVAQLLTVPDETMAEGDDADDDSTDPFAELRADIGSARGKALLVESTAAGYGTGQTAAPRRDWLPSRLGPMPPAELVEVARDSFARMLAACGSNVSMFSDADGTAQREALRRWHAGTVLPLAALLEAELCRKLECEVRLEFDKHALDVVGRAGAFQSLTDGGADVTTAAAAVGLDLTPAPEPQEVPGE